MREFDDDVLECFLDNQLQLFPEKVAETLDEAEGFLEECMAVVVNSVDEVIGLRAGHREPFKPAQPQRSSRKAPGRSCLFV